MSHKSLQDFVEEAGGGSHLRVEHDFGDGFVRLRTSEAERRQAAQDIRSSENVLLELLRNSKDAHASNIFVASSKEGINRSLTVIDDGVGIPESMHDHVFEPRVTSKLDTSHMDAWGLHGRGMALYSISVNAESSEIIDSSTDLGCSIQVVTSDDRLGEKKDQSTFPSFYMSEEGTVNVRGPKNLLRTACEFAIETRGSCSVYMGSPAEIVSTLVSFGMVTLSSIDRVFCNDPKELPLVKRLATASDPCDLAELCQSIGLAISERTARRVLDGQIPSAESMLDRISIHDPAGKNKGKRKGGGVSNQRIRLQKQDVDLLAESVGEAFSEVAERYYLDSNVVARVRSNAGYITIAIPVVRKP